MTFRSFLASVIAVSISLTGGSPHRNQEPPVVTDKDVNILSRGDIFAVDDMLLHHGNNLKTKRFKREAVGDDYKWPYKTAAGTVVIPYTTDLKPNSEEEKIFQRAVEVFNAKTCIRFTPRQPTPNDPGAKYVSFRQGKWWRCRVGYRVKDTEHVCTLKGVVKGKVLHEIMHVLGFLHEHCRADRDNTITVHKDKITQGLEKQFEIYQGKDLGLPYDCDSILQYKATAFGKTPSSVTISSSKCSKLGNGDTRLSLLDYKRVNTFYSCRDNPDYRYFKVVVVTRSSFLSGTDCYIYLKLHGSQRDSTEFELDLDESGSTNLFERSSSHTFNYMAYRNDLGAITGISIRMVAHGSAKQWKPVSITIYDPVQRQQVKFASKFGWIKPARTYGPFQKPSVKPWNLTRWLG